MGSVALPVTVRARRKQAPTKPFLDSVLSELTSLLSRAGALGEIAAPMVLSSSAKRARARLVELVGSTVEVESADLVHIAVAVELIHAASLLHDDVIDEASERRGLPTANAIAGPKLAILSGDLLLALALDRLRPVGSFAVDRTIGVVAEMAAGVASEFIARGDLDLSLEAWRRMAEAKTGALFGLAASLVVERAGHKDDALCFDLALRRLGVAFQIADDASDYFPSGLETPYQDLRDGVPSLATLVAVSRDSALKTDVKRLIELAALGGLEPGQLEATASRVLQTGAADIAIAEVFREIESARAALEPVQWVDIRAGGLAAVFEWADTLASSLDARRTRAARAASNIG